MIYTSVRYYIDCVYFLQGVYIKLYSEMLQMYGWARDEIT